MISQNLTKQIPIQPCRTLCLVQTEPNIFRKYKKPLGSQIKFWFLRLHSFKTGIFTSPVYQVGQPRHAPSGEWAILKHNNWL